MTTNRHEAQLGLLMFLEYCEETGKKPIRANYMKWRVSDVPGAGNGIDITAVNRHYGSWDEAMRQIAPARKEWQEDEAARRAAASATQVRQALGARPTTTKLDEWSP